MPKHSVEAPLDCKDCGKTFNWKHALTAHSVIHAPVNGPVRHVSIQRLCHSLCNQMGLRQNALACVSPTVSGLKSGYRKRHRNKAVPGQLRVSLKNNGKY